MWVAKFQRVWRDQFVRVMLFRVEDSDDSRLRFLLLRLMGGLDVGRRWRGSCSWRAPWCSFRVEALKPPGCYGR